MLCGPKSTVKKARRLRRLMTPPEVILWHRLRRRPGGFKFRRQHPAGAYVLDFFCSGALLVVEVDGIAHEMGDNPQADARRDQWLRDRGIDVLRLSAADVSKAPDSAVEAIVATCGERGSPLHQPAAGPPPRSGQETS
ncbi:MAG: endonuclease domain-containing protein [Sphingomonas sp.]|nr:endonuclease domain-containing protein [Sphingomonas sp.]